jgi:hypothetical protein
LQHDVTMKTNLKTHIKSFGIATREKFDMNIVTISLRHPDGKYFFPSDIFYKHLHICLKRQTKLAFMFLTKKRRHTSDISVSLQHTHERHFKLFLRARRERMKIHRDEIRKLAFDIILLSTCAHSLSLPWSKARLLSFRSIWV